MKTIAQIKEKIVEIHKKWSAVGDSLDDFKDAEYYESNVIDLILKYCTDNKYAVDGFPFLHEELAKSNDGIDSDYFSERNLLYLYRLADEMEDVFELLHYYWSLFWPDIIETIED